MLTSVAPTRYTLQDLASFNGANGLSPEAGLIMDSSGNLYGTTWGGGADGEGTVFEVANGSGTITTLATFDGTNGSEPNAGLIMDDSGNLYGTTRNGSATGVGTVFEVVNGSGTITTLATFDNTHGAHPQASLIMDGSGNLYGTTLGGGAGSCGTVFEVAHGSGTITTLTSFNGPNGSTPLAGLIMDDDGNLFGTTALGGANDSGIVFEWQVSSGTIVTLATFDSTNGASPSCSLIMDSGGENLR